MDKRKLARLALDACLTNGAEYVDIRWERIIDENLSVSTGVIDPIEKTESEGIGIRVIKNGAWGFAATDRLDEATLKKKAFLATQIAGASALVNKTPVNFPPGKAVKGTYLTAHEIDPFTISLEEKMNFLTELDKMMADQGGEILNSRNGFVSFRNRKKYFISSEGSEIEQTLINSGAGISLGMSVSHRERYERSWPTSSGQYESKGYELLSELDFENAIPELVEDIKALQIAKECPEKVTTLLLSGDQVSLQMHESIGHPLELDRVFGTERNFSGTSFATTDNLGQLKYGAENITITSDSTSPHGLASYGYDDEGTPARPVKLIDKGILTDYLSSRETAAKINKQSTAAMRANSWLNVPIVRITNLNLTPGTESYETLLSEIDDGILMDGVRSWSIDDERKNFQFGCEIGWLIKGGQKVTPIKNPTYSGCTTEFWNNCSGIADRNSYRIWGTPNCGKGQPGQNARTAQGASPSRFELVQVGV